MGAVIAAAALAAYRRLVARLQSQRATADGGSSGPRQERYQEIAAYLRKAGSR